MVTGFSFLCRKTGSPLLVTWGGRGGAAGSTLTSAWRPPPPPPRPRRPPFQPLALPDLPDAGAHPGLGPEPRRAGRPGRERPDVRSGGPPQTEGGGLPSPVPRPEDQGEPGLDLGQRTALPWAALPTDGPAERPGPPGSDVGSDGESGSRPHALRVPAEAPSQERRGVEAASPAETSSSGPSRPPSQEHPKEPGTANKLPLPQEQPQPQELPQEQPQPQELPQEQPQPQELPQDQPQPQELPQDQPQPQELPQDQPQPQELPQDQPQPQELPQDQPQPQELPQDQPQPQELPQDQMQPQPQEGPQERRHSKGHHHHSKHHHHHSKWQQLPQEQPQPRRLCKCQKTQEPPLRVKVRDTLGEPRTLAEVMLKKLEAWDAWRFGWVRCQPPEAAGVATEQPKDKPRDGPEPTQASQPCASFKALRKAIQKPPSWLTRAWQQGKKVVCTCTRGSS
ncbi:cell surface glycoprotein 1-like isoform X1 [Monodelphis domestica]|uniref:cell surface glycoprotein 1-like isoform X1 n=1 Tax=Monodelphis domestica TaxID=13616 RepID=UPI0024E21968|nr:cell surface glycoprotein 1-like isoform X1 [Monodelphis domestica]XP_056681703.1 cell surface glycoprotein 1-like isoform X1 [Monodelphis domestica]